MLNTKQVESSPRTRGLRPRTEDDGGDPATREILAALRRASVATQLDEALRAFKARLETEIAQ